jgi:uncharacterized membrane protein YphA (DoxX/SURF4 family)
MACCSKNLLVAAVVVVVVVVVFGFVFPQYKNCSPVKQVFCCFTAMGHWLIVAVYVVLVVFRVVRW